MIVVPFSESLWTVLVREIDAIASWQRRELVDYTLPFRISFHSETFTPALRHAQTKRPVRQFKRRIPRFTRRMILLRRDHRWPKYVSLPGCLEVSIRRHEL